MSFSQQEVFVHLGHSVWTQARFQNPRRTAPPPIQMSPLPRRPPLHELSLMCQTCQTLSTMLKELCGPAVRTVSLCVRLVPWVHCGGRTGRAHLQDPLVLPALYACQASPPIPWEETSPPHPPLFKSDPECNTDGGNVINWPFVSAAASTGSK